MALTAQQISIIRINIGDDESTPVYSEVELNVFNDIAIVQYPDIDNVSVVTVYALRGLLANAAKLSKYIQNESEEDMSKVFDNLYRLLGLWQDIAGLSVNTLFLGTINLDLDTDSSSFSDEWEGLSYWYA